MKIMLNVPFSEREEAKKLRCRWDRASKRWYVENVENLDPFLRWIPEHLKSPHKPIQKNNISQTNKPP